jgi:membrane protein
VLVTIPGLVAHRPATDDPHGLEAQHRRNRDDQEEQRLLQRQIARQHDAEGLTEVEGPMPGPDRQYVPHHERRDDTQQCQTQPASSRVDPSPQQELQRQRREDDEDQHGDVGELRHVSPRLGGASPAAGPSLGQSRRRPAGRRPDEPEPQWSARWLARRTATEVRRLLRGMGIRLRGRDLTLAAAGLTFYSGIAVVPCLLLSVWLAGLVSSPDAVAMLGGRLAEVLPRELGAAAPVDRLFDAGRRLGWLGAVVAAFPASFYGEGLRRAFLRFTHRDEPFVGWRGRLLVLPLLVAAPFLLLPLLLVAGVLHGLPGRYGAASGLIGVVIGFTAVWLVLAVTLVWTFRVVGPARSGRVAVVVGALLTAACLSGFPQGFVLFLSLPLDLGAPFGGLTGVGVVVAVGLWLLLLHVIVLVGWVFTLALEDRLRGDAGPASASNPGGDR